MEQKHLDEMDESYFGEETIDDDYPILKVEEKKKEHKTEVKKEEKKPLSATKTVKVAPVVVKKKEPEIIHEEDLKEEVQIKPARVEPMKEHRQFKPTPIEPIEVTPKKQDSEPAAVKIEEKKPLTTEVVAKPNSGSSGWKWVALILLIVVIVSIYTNGFGLYHKAVPGQVSLSEAEQRMLDYVNSNLLPPPLVAEVVDRVEEPNLYRFTLSVAGEEIESYVTKDGQLFFPRGFDMNNITVSVGGNTSVSQNQTPASETSIPEIKPETSTNTSSVDTPVSVQTETPKNNGVELTLLAKKWMFDPNTLYLKVGEKVKLTIKSTDLDFVFSIPEFGVKANVSGITLIEFTPTKTGTYKYLCNSCESWRGLEGTLVIQ